MDVSTRIVVPGGLDLIAVDTAKQFMNVAHEYDDELIHVLLTTAAEVVQLRAERQLLTATIELRLPYSGLTYPEPIQLPFPPLQSVVGVFTTDYEDNETEVDPDDYRVDTVGNGTLGAIYLNESIACDRARVVYKAGYGDEPNSVPNGIRHTIQTLAMFWYENREMSGQIPQHIDCLLSMYRTWTVT